MLVRFSIEDKEMKKFTIIILLTLLSYAALGEDVELYISAGVKQAVKRPQVLVVFDTSGSMRTHSLTVKSDYDPSEHYDPVTAGSSIYYSVGDSSSLELPKVDDSNEKRFFSAKFNNCETARTILNTNGFYTGHIRYYNLVGNTGRWSELPNNDGSTITVIDCEDDVLNSDPNNKGIDPKTGKKFKSDKQGYPVDGLGTSAAPQYFIANKLQSNVDWSGQLVTLYTDNYLRWNQGDVSNSKIGTTTKTRMEIAKASLTQVVQSTPSIDFGLQIFNPSLWFNYSRHYYNGGRIISGVQEMTPTHLNTYTTLINNLKGAGSTPLCETLYEASRYFAGGGVEYADDFPTWKAPTRDFYIENAGKYISPFKGCGNNAFVILVTDGEPTNDDSANNKIEALSVVEDGVTVNFSGSKYNSSYLAALAGWMHEHDINPNVEGRQTVNTYTIGFGSGVADAEPLLKEAAKLGGGRYFPAKNSQDLTKALIKTLQGLKPANESLTSASIASNNFDNTQTLDYVYYAMFEPQSGPRWQGNLKKYKVINKEQYGSNGVAVIDTDGTFSDKVQSYWSPDVDGIDVASGGVADILRKKTNRVLYSDLSTGTNLVKFNLSNAERAFGGAAALAAKMNVPEAELATYIDWAKGKNVDKVKLEDESIPTMRPDVFGDPLHSKPLVINYGTSIRILIGTNAGVLHMFEDEGNSVDETWAFMPKEFIPNISKLRNNFSSSSKVYGIDGKISSYIKDNNGDGIVNGDDKVWIFFGLRRGGSSYYAMDITNPSSPILMWHKDSSSAGFSQLGQSWAEPQIAYSKLNLSGNNAAPVLFIGGGYDPTKDSSGVGGNDTVGKAIYMLDAATGNILWSLEPSGGTTAFSGTDSIPSEIAILDSDSDGLVDRLYAGDTGGNVWRVDMPSDNPNSSTEPWTVFKLASLGGGDNDIDRRFFYAPSIVRTFITETIETSVTDENGVTTQIKVKQEKPYDAILIASGDRSHPLGVDTNDMLFMLKDEHIKTQSFSGTDIPTAITIAGKKINGKEGVGGLYDYTNNPFKDYISSETGREKVGLSASQKSALENLSLAVSEKSGWFINLVKAGEKSTSTPIAINGIAYFVTYTPPPFIDPGVCNMPRGIGSTYVVDLVLGIKKYNIKNTKGVTTRADDERVLDISHDWIDGVSLIVPPSPNAGTTESEGSIILGYQVLPVGFDLHTMRTSLYVTED